MRCVTVALEGATGSWMFIFHNDDALELRNFNCFMAELCRCFKDPLTNHKARDHIKTISQGWRSMDKNTQEFCDLACWLNNWLQDSLISCFKHRLTDELYKTCISRGITPFFMAGMSSLRRQRLTLPETSIA